MVFGFVTIVIINMDIEFEKLLVNSDCSSEIHTYS